MLTLGFARRFATYKRAVLMFRDVERLKRILNDPQCPVQILFAGKAHPPTTLVSNSFVTLSILPRLPGLPVTSRL